MKFSELQRRLERDGWYIERTKGHHIYAHPIKPGKIPLESMVQKRYRPAQQIRY
ncbi:MAG: type II toxin-antitoxin system HicA family toxin [Agriterribacter sp.]